MKNYCPAEMEIKIQVVEPIEFEPVTLAHGNEESPLNLSNLLET